MDEETKPRLAVENSISPLTVPTIAESGAEIDPNLATQSDEEDAAGPTYDEVGAGVENGSIVYDSTDDSSKKNHPTLETKEIDEIIEPTKEEREQGNDPSPTVIANSLAPPSPGRISVASSIASIDDGAVSRVLVDSMDWMGSTECNPKNSIPRLESFSARSVESKPDPPSSVDGRQTDQDAAVAAAQNDKTETFETDHQERTETFTDSRDVSVLVQNMTDGPELRSNALPSASYDDTQIEEISTTRLSPTYRKTEEQPLSPLSKYQPTIGADDLTFLSQIDDQLQQEYLLHAHQEPDKDIQSKVVIDRSTSFHHAVMPDMNRMTMNNFNGRRKIKLRLQEEVKNTTSSIRKHFRHASLLGSIRRNSTRVLRFGGSSSSYPADFDTAEEQPLSPLYSIVDHGSVSVSWYEGTSSLELWQHVQKTIIRKMKLDSANVALNDVRILDETMNPPDEIILSPFLPDGSQFLLRFSMTKSSNTLKTETDGMITPRSEWSGRVPVSPSAAPSPHPEKDNTLANLNATQMALLNALKKPSEKAKYDEKKIKKATTNITSRSSNQDLKSLSTKENINSKNDVDDVYESFNEDDMILHSEDPIENSLRQITEILLADRKQVEGSTHGREKRQKEKRQVVFVVANYFVLFLALIALSAEIQARAPNWLKVLEEHLQSVRNCGESQEALYECVSRGDFAGLIASLLLWLSRSVATKRIFLFGFDTPKKLWTVVYESLVTSICWGVSYLFIRRGMNPDTRSRFVQKYWKDAVYGSLAGFNAAFMKQVLKNLIPQEVVEDALRERHLKVLRWLPSLGLYHD